MGFTSETLAAMTADASAEMAVLIEAARPASLAAAGGAAAQTGGRGDPWTGTAALDPGRLFELARLNKMLGVLPLAPGALPPGCGVLAPRLLQVHLQTVSMNRRAIAVTVEVAQALRDVRHVVIKGPFQQLAVHGNGARRPSGDIDLFVAPRDRARAGDVLRSLGFRPAEEDRALWWIGFLGEQHFTRAADGAVVDLHHRLQQVGLPGWRRAEAVLDRAEYRSEGGAQVRVPAAVDGCLLLAVTVAKAVLAHEPCGWAVADLAHWLGQLQPAAWQQLWRNAREARQDRTLALALAMVAACHRVPRLADGSAAEPLVGLPRGLPRDAALLRDLVFQPWRRTTAAGAAQGADDGIRGGATRRRHMLQMLAQGRPHVLAAEALRAALSPLVLKGFERRQVAKGRMVERAAGPRD